MTFPVLPIPQGVTAATKAAVKKVGSLEYQVAALLETPEVKAIHFRLGHVLVEPLRLGKVAAALRSGKVTIDIDPIALAGGGAAAAYDPTNNRFILKSKSVLLSKIDRSVVVHEAVHAALDWRGQQTAELFEEGAAFIAECWYLQELGDTTPGFGVDTVAFDIAKDLRKRAQTEKAPVKATATQINTIWERMLREYSYQPKQYRNDGFK